jgi:hypothetical protein
MRSELMRTLTNPLWRYQPVIVKRLDDDPYVVLVECYFDADGRLTMWAEDPHSWPQGDDVEGLANDLSFMLAAVYKWKPVDFDSLHVGMTFERTGVDVEQVIAAMNAFRPIGANAP